MGNLLQNISIRKVKMPYWVVWGYKSHSMVDKSISFFGFPKDQQRLKIWVHYCKRQTFSSWKYSKICWKHFTECQYSRNPARLAEMGYHKLNVALKDVAVPDVPVVIQEDHSFSRCPKTQTSLRKGEKASGFFFFF